MRASYGGGFVRRTWLRIVWTGRLWSFEIWVSVGVDVMLRLRAVSAGAFPGQVARANGTWHCVVLVAVTWISQALQPHTFLTTVRPAVPLRCHLPGEDGRNYASKPTHWKLRHAVINPPSSANYLAD
jgi:hypothetical protein